MKRTHQYSIIISFLLTLFSGCMPFSLPDDLHRNPHYKNDSIKASLEKYPYKNSRGDANDIRMIGKPKSGQRNIYGVGIGKNFELVYENYLKGDVQATLKYLDNIKEDEHRESDIDLTLWEERFQRIKTLMLSGQGDDALDLIPECIKYEERAFNGNVNCTALKGEVNIFLENYKDAEADFLSVLSSNKDWNLPSIYLLIPTNMDKLVYVTVSQIRSMAGLSAVYFFQHKFKESFYWAKQSEKRINTVMSLVNHAFYGKFIKPHMEIYYGAGTTLTMLASGYLLVDNNISKAEALYKEASKYYESVGIKRGEAFVPTFRAYAYLYSGQSEKALKVAQEALSFVNRYGFFDLSWRIEVEKGRFLYHQGEQDKAEQAFRSAQKTLRYISNSLGSDHAKVNFGVGKEGITNYLVKIDIAKKDYAQLFSDLEEGRSRAFLDLFSGTIIENQHNPLLSKIKKLDEEILRQSIMLGANHNDSKLSSKLTFLREQRATALIGLRLASPRLASAISIWSGKLEDFQKNLKENEKALYYFINDKKLSFLEITKHTISLQQPQTNISNMQIELDNLYDTVAHFDTKHKTRGLKRNRKLSALAQGINFKNQKKIVMKHLAFPKQNAKTYIIPSGVINFVPWGVLDLDYPVALLTSAALLNYPKELMDSQNNAVIIGNPNFGGELPQLQGAEDEAKHVAKLYNTTALIHNNASEDQLHQSIGRGTKVLHLATHGTFDNNDPLASAIYLSKDGKSDKLTAREIYKNPFKAQLVVLSACETGLGKSISGDDLLGLTRTFFLGGSSAVLNTLWEVDDKGTKEFMKVFHQYAKNGHYSQGYMKARQHLKDRGYPPSIYGAFILNGKDLQ